VADLLACRFVLSTTIKGKIHRNMEDNIKPAILATNAVLIVLSSAAIACRIGRRIFLVRSFSWHDGELRRFESIDES
jgi:hypothetical protein